MLSLAQPTPKDCKSEEPEEIIATNASIYNTILPIITSNFSTTS